MSRITVRVVPNASTSQVVGKDGGTWKIRLAAPPVDGKANEALVRFLAKALDLPPSQIVIVNGQTSKTKLIDIPMHEADIEQALCA